jgi:hypothetical protein
MTFLGMGAGVAGTSTRDVVDSGMLLLYAIAPNMPFLPAF